MATPNPTPLRLMLYDQTCRNSSWRPGLSQAWSSGGVLYRALRRIDAYQGVQSWSDALAFLQNHQPQRPIAEIQFWGHGRWGRAFIAKEILDISALQPDHALHDGLARVRDRMLRGSDGLFWFRTCETFGMQAGHAFAQAFTRFMDCRTAGHTYVIGLLQSGLHSLLPGQTPAWPLDEGLPEGQQNPKAARMSHPGAPNTITCFHGQIPDGF